MQGYHYKQLLIYSRRAMILIAIFLIAFLLSKDLVLSGKISYSHDFLSRSAFFTELVPKQRVEQGGEGMQIQQDPVYTTLSYPRPFKTATAELVFSNDQNLLLEYGYQVGPGEDFLLQAIDHPQLNPLFSPETNWTGTATEDQGVSLYQKRSAPYIYTSTDQFWRDLPQQDITGYYGIDIETPYIPRLKSGDATVTVPLRGGHEFFSVTEDEPFDLQVSFYDLNELSEPDDLTLTLYSWDGEVLASESVIDDRDEIAGLATDELLLRMHVDGLEKGQVVKLVLSASSDIVISKIQSSSSYLVANGHLWIAGGPSYYDGLGAEALETIRLQTSARSLVARADSRHTTQHLFIGSESLILEKPFETYRYTKSAKESYLISKGYEFVAESGGVQIDGRGVFAFAPSQYFSPFPWFINESLSLEEAGVSYVVTDYRPPVVAEGGKKVGSIMIDFAEAFAPEKRLRTQFSAPQVTESADILIHSITVGYESDPVTFSNMFEKGKRFIKREFLP